MKELTITLYKSEILYEVQNKAFLTGQSKLTDDNAPAVAVMQASDDDSNLNQLLRSIGAAYAQLKVKLSAYAGASTEPAKLNTDNKQIGIEDNFIFNLKITPNYNHDFTDAATQAMHGYMVNKTLADWFMLTNPSEAAVYYQLAENDLSASKNYLGARIKPIRRKLSTF